MIVTTTGTKTIMRTVIPRDVKAIKDLDPSVVCIFDISGKRTVIKGSVMTMKGVVTKNWA
jgi:hypothetical protein